MAVIALMSAAQDRVLATRCELFALDFFTHILPLHREKESRSHVTYLLHELQGASVMEQEAAANRKMKTENC